MKTIEICPSVEWLEVFSALNFEGIDDIDGAANAFTNDLFDGLTDAGFEVIIARRQRATCHGWNGANTFEFRFGPAMSSSALTNDECGMIQECIDIAEENMRSSYVERSDNDD